jgi:DNA-binding beta-propeller fold protein YncE
MGLSGLDVASFPGLLAVVVGVSLCASRSEESAEDCFLAGRALRWWLVGISLVLLPLLGSSLVETRVLHAADPTALPVRTIDTSQFSPPSPDPAGIIYLPLSQRLLVSDSEVNEMPIFRGVNLFETTLTGELVATSTTLSFSNEPTGLALNPANGHLFVSDDNARDIFEVDPGPDGRYGSPDDLITSFDTTAFGSDDPEGITYDSGEDVLYVADGVDATIYRVDPGPNGVFDGIPPAGDDGVDSFQVDSLGVSDPEGIAFNPDRGTLYVVGQPSSILIEVTRSGALVRTIGISAAGATKPAGLAYGPGSVDPSSVGLYIAARGVDNGSDPSENDGKIFEISLTSPRQKTTPPKRSPLSGPRRSGGDR